MLPLHRSESRQVTHGSGQTLEKGEKQVNCSTGKGGDTQVPCPASFQNHGMTTTAGVPENGSYLIWNWSSLCETFEYLWEGTSKVITALIPEVVEVSSWPHSRIKLSHAFVHGSPSPLYQAPMEWLQVGIISDIFMGTNFFTSSIAWETF